MGRPFTPEALAERWDCSAETIRQMIHRGELAGFRVGPCAADDHRPPPEERIIERLTFEHTIGLLADIDETLEDCVRRDGWRGDDD